MHLSVQRIKHCSRSHILPPFPLPLSLPVSWCPHWWSTVLVPAQRVIYSPVTLHDYQANNLKMNCSLGLAFPSLARKQTTCHLRGMMKWSPLSFLLLPKENSYGIFPLLLYKAIFFSHWGKNVQPLSLLILNTKTLPPGNAGILIWVAAQKPELLQGWDSTIWAATRPCCASLQTNSQRDGPLQPLALSHAPEKNYPQAGGDNWITEA